MIKEIREEVKHCKYSCKLMSIHPLSLVDLYDLMVNSTVGIFFIGKPWEPCSRLMLLWLQVILMWVEFYYHHLCQVSFDEFMLSIENLMWIVMQIESKYVLISWLSLLKDPWSFPWNPHVRYVIDMDIKSNW